MFLFKATYKLGALKNIHNTQCQI